MSNSRGMFSVTLKLVGDMFVPSAISVVMSVHAGGGAVGGSDLRSEHVLKCILLKVVTIDFHLYGILFRHII